MFSVPFCIDFHAMKKLFLLLLKHPNFTIYRFYNLKIILVIISFQLPLIKLNNMWIYPAGETKETLDKFLFLKKYVKGLESGSRLFN